jgi:predicted  nucleic acid-binding Zn-ribbon protein
MSRGLRAIPPWRYFQCTACGQIQTPDAARQSTTPCAGCGANSWRSPPIIEEADS